MYPFTVIFFSQFFLFVSFSLVLLFSFSLSPSPLTPRFCLLPDPVLSFSLSFLRCYLSGVLLLSTHFYSLEVLQGTGMALQLLVLTKLLKSHHFPISSDFPKHVKYLRFRKKEESGIDPKSHLTSKTVPDQNPQKASEKSQKWQFYLGRIM